MSAESILPRDAEPSATPIERVVEWLQNDAITKLVQRHHAFMKGGEIEMGFNLFHLISDVYHRENLHSDMMEAIISPTGSHDQGGLFLGLFLNFLKKQHGVAINAKDYENAKVVRENGRIDLLIYEETSHNVKPKAIIVENKINGAPDMHKQVAGYLKKVEADGYTCDAIVYLCLNQNGHPDLHDWKTAEIAAVQPLLKAVCAYDEGSGNDLLTGWLTPCIDALKTDDADAHTPQREEVAYVLRQYCQLIRKLGQTHMNKPIMKDFYQIMLDKKQHDSAMNVVAMVNDLPVYRCQRVLDIFQKDHRPFHRLVPYKPSSSLAIFEGLAEGRLKLHVDCTSQDSTKLEFWNNSDDDPRSELAGQILKEIGMTDSLPYDSESEKFTCRFGFPEQEKALFEFIRVFIAALQNRSSTPA